jgi:WD40 repeat protein
MEPGDPQERHGPGEAVNKLPLEPQRDEVADRERRQRALSELAQHAGTPPASYDTISRSPLPLARTEHPAGSKHPRRRTPWFIVVAVLLALALVAVVVLPRFLSAPKRPAPAAITIDSGADTLACAQDVAWSPSGTSIAILGYYPECPNTDSSQPYQSGQVSIYDAKTGKLIRSLSLDPLILRTVHVTLGQPVSTVNDTLFAPYIQYQSVLWSPNGEQLAFPFVVLQHSYEFQDPSNPQLIQDLSQSTSVGVLLTDVAGSTSHTLVASTTLPRTGQAPSMEWDLQSGRLVSASLTLPPSLSYAWGENGTLLPLHPLTIHSTPTAVPLAPIGNPIGGKTFTIWQPGTARQGSYVTAVVGNGTGATTKATQVPGLNLWYSNFAVWSPDGRYLVTPANYGGRMLLPGQPTPSSHDLQATGLERAPVFLPRDRVLQSYFLASIYYAPAAWQFDGKVVATLSFHSTNGGNTVTAQVTLWDCASGKELRSFTAKTAAGPLPDQVMRWSPDGSQLLFFDPNPNGLVTIWPTR